MTTMTISLPDNLATKLDRAVDQAGFATRSELVRSLIRRYFSSDLELEPFESQPLAEVKSKLSKAGKYNREFVDSVTQGLAKSSAYAR